MPGYAYEFSGYSLTHSFGDELWQPTGYPQYVGPPWGLEHLAYETKDSDSIRIGKIRFLNEKQDLMTINQNIWVYKRNDGGFHVSGTEQHGISVEGLQNVFILNGNRDTLTAAAGPGLTSLFRESSDSYIFYAHLLHPGSTVVAAGFLGGNQLILLDNRNRMAILPL